MLTFFLSFFQRVFSRSHNQSTESVALVVEINQTKQNGKNTDILFLTSTYS